MISVNYKKDEKKKKREKDATSFEWIEKITLSGVLLVFGLLLRYFSLLFVFLIFHVLQSKMVRKLIVIFFSMERNIQYAGAKSLSF